MKWGIYIKILKVCIGSACHLKGSYDVVEALKSLTKENNIEEQLEIGMAFCLGHCSQNGVSVQRWDNKILCITKETAREVFEKHIMSSL